MWSGSRLQEHHARLRDALSVMPQARLEPMLLEPESLSFYLAGACPTEAVVQRGVEALEDTSDLGWSGDDMVADLVRGFGAAAYDSLKEAIGEGRVDRREKVIEVVAASEEPAAAEILVAALQDSAKGIRQTAPTRWWRSATTPPWTPWATRLAVVERPPAWRPPGC